MTSCSSGNLLNALFFQADMATWAKVIKESGARMD
jgi:hypothetical protein